MSGFQANPEVEEYIEWKRPHFVAAVIEAAHDGMTCAEVEHQFYGVKGDHGIVSGALSVANTKSELVCLAVTRLAHGKRHRIYVDPDLVDGRPVYRMGEGNAV